MSKWEKREENLDALRAKRLAQLQKETLNKSVESVTDDLSKGDKLWNGAIKGMIGMMDAIMKPTGDGLIYQWDPNLFGQAYQMASQATALMSQLQPDKLEQLNSFLKLEVTPIFENLLTELRA